MKTLATDPRDLTPEDMRRLGVERTSRANAIRRMCLQCMGGSHLAVRECESGGCPLFWFRTNYDPWRTPMSEEQRAAASERLTGARAAMVEAAPTKRVSLFEDDEED